MLAFCDVAHFLPLGGEDGDFPFTEVETRRHFSWHLTGTFRKQALLALCILIMGAFKHIFIKMTGLHELNVDYFTWKPMFT